MQLTCNEKDILEKIVGYGGYITKEILALYRNEVVLDRCYRILADLEKKGYIRKREYFSRYKMPTVYQVTRKACSYYGRADSYMRKVHQPYAIRRYLTRSHFLFSISTGSVPTKLFSSVSREEYLRYRGYSNYHLTKKTNKGIEKIQVEEFILEQEPYSKSNSICFIYIDNLNHTPYGQLAHLLEKYSRMIRAGRAFIDFIIVTENNDRKENFENLYRNQFEKTISMVGVQVVSINTNYASQRDV